MNRFQAASAIAFVLSTLTLAAQCGSVDGGTAGKPFRAEFHCRDTQTLANGAQVVRENSGVVARDGEGRTYVKTSPHGPNMPVSVYVHDWAKGTTTAWQEPKEGDGGKQDSVRMTAMLWRGVPVVARPQPVRLAARPVEPAERLPGALEIRGLEGADRFDKDQLRQLVEAVQLPHRLL